MHHGWVVDYVSQYRRKALAAKVGWLRSVFADQWGFPESKREALQELRPRGVVIFEAAKAYLRDPGGFPPRRVRLAERTACFDFPSPDACPVASVQLTNESDGLKTAGEPPCRPVPPTGQRPQQGTLGVPL